MDACGLKSDSCQAALNSATNLMLDRVEESQLYLDLTWILLRVHGLTFYKSGL